MNSSQAPDPITAFNWSGTVLNVHTIALMLICPFWSAFLLADGQGLAVLVMLVLLAGMIGLVLAPKPLFSYDSEKRVFISAEGQTMALDQIDTIEMDSRDLYFIPKSHTQDGWHLSQKCWTLSPRRVLKTAADQHGWPLKDISSPVTRFGFWLVP